MEKVLIESINKIFTKKECELIKSYAKLKIRQVDVLHDGKYDSAGGRMLSDKLLLNDERYSWIRDKIQTWVDSLNLNPRINMNGGGEVVLCHYLPGMYFIPHTDDVAGDELGSKRPDGIRKEIKNNELSVRKRIFTIGVQLSDKDEYTGGELQFETEDGTHTMNQEQGSVWVASTGWVHWVNKIESGIRWSIQIFIENDLVEELNGRN
tara:strand:+ start:474 stop:1097 length:624 start_codon:yes stop_codon:yes gene_type:complete